MPCLPCLPQNFAAGMLWPGVLCRQSQDVRPSIRMPAPRALRLGRWDVTRELELSAMLMTPLIIRLARMQWPLPIVPRCRPGRRSPRPRDQLPRSGVPGGVGGAGGAGGGQGGGVDAGACCGGAAGRDGQGVEVPGRLQGQEGKDQALEGGDQCPVTGSRQKEEEEGGEVPSPGGSSGPARDDVDEVDHPVSQDAVAPLPPSHRPRVQARLFIALVL